jgi:universal stress protein A
MLQFKKILMATDFGAPSAYAIEAAIDLAKNYAAKLYVMHAYPLPTAIYGMYALTIPPAALAADVERGAREALDACVAKVMPRFANVEAVLRMGEAWEEIIRASKDLHVDLIVIGTHGHQGLSRLFLGSVAEKVVRLASVPVFTVRANTDRTEPNVDARGGDHLAGANGHGTHSAHK